MVEPTTGEDLPEDKGDLNEIFDLDRTGLTKKLVSDFENCILGHRLALEEKRGVIKAAMEAQYSKRDIAMMQQWAKLRIDDKLGQIGEQLEALEKISDVLGVNVFTAEFRRRLKVRFKSAENDDVDD